MRILVLIAVLALTVVGCGDDDDGGAGGAGSGGTGEAVAPPPERAFSDLTTALEGQGLTVTQLPKAALHGAEVGISISGDRGGSARSFATGTMAQDYADEVAKEGEKTTIVGTVVFQAKTQEDADFFASAYEG